MDGIRYTVISEHSRRVARAEPRLRLPQNLIQLVNFRASPAVIGTVDFGDGTTGTMEQAPTCFGCPTLSVAAHVYQSPGTYPARLVSAGGPLGSQVITVTN